MRHCTPCIPGGTAIYRWQGELFTEPQVQLLIKTRSAVWPALRTRVLELHSDDVPEILALPVIDGLSSYRHWLEEQTPAASDG